jgi:aspartyl-tRNA(Asn)/glutamyl-tRNA(Gln) amidotransferase subunit B
MGFEAMSESATESVVDQVIADNPDAWEKFVGGDQKVMGLFVGQVLQRTNKQADGKLVNEILRRKAGG